VRSVFRGSVATIARDGPGSAAYFAAYEVTKGLLTPAGSKDLNLGAVIFAGGMAGVAMWSIAIPPDVCIHLVAFCVGDATDSRIANVGHQVQDTICTFRHIFWLPRLRA
jgi:hypothetical protein